MAINNNNGGVDNGNRGSVLSNDVYIRMDNKQYFGSDSRLLSESVLTLNNGSNTFFSRPLVVLAVRGTVSCDEWKLDINEVIDIVPGGFATGKDIVMSTLYGRNIAKENCPYKSNHDIENDTGCSYCVGYLEAYGLNDPDNPPIILITGHSLGAAVANLTAAHLSSCDEDGCPCGGASSRNVNDIYAYTFATPNTINPNREIEASAASVDYGAISYYSDSDKEDKGCENIFNILNSNDFITFYPDSMLKAPTTSAWSRHGNSFRFTMPLNVKWLSCLDESILGLGGHAMPNYLQWLRGLSARVSQNVGYTVSDDDITAEHLEAFNTPNAAVGLLPFFAKIKCPVDVTLKNSDDEIVAFVTSQSNDSVVIPNGLTELEFDTGVIGEQSAGSETENTGTAATDGSGIIAWTTSDGAKYIMLPYGYGEVTAEIEAYASGTMDISVETAGIGRAINRTVRNDITIAENEIFTLTVPANIEENPPTVTDSTGQEIEWISPLLHSVEVINPEVTYGTKTEIVVRTATNVSKIQFRLSGTNTTITIAQDSSLIERLETIDGMLVWTIKRKFTSGTLTYDVGTKVGNTWTYNDRIFTILVN